VDYPDHRVIRAVRKESCEEFQAKYVCYHDYSHG
jgi:hypothetical protein